MAEYEEVHHGRPESRPVFTLQLVRTAGQKKRLSISHEDHQMCASVQSRQVEGACDGGVEVSS